MLLEQYRAQPCLRVLTGAAVRKTRASYEFFFFPLPKTLKLVCLSEAREGWPVSSRPGAGSCCDREAAPGFCLSVRRLNWCQSPREDGPLAGERCRVGPGMLQPGGGGGGQEEEEEERDNDLRLLVSCCQNDR